jgi:hypothetical protein
MYVIVLKRCKVKNVNLHTFLWSFYSFPLLAASGVVPIGLEVDSVAEDFVRGLYVAWPITV